MWNRNCSLWKWQRGEQETRWMSGPNRESLIMLSPEAANASCKLRELIRIRILTRIRLWTAESAVVCAAILCRHLHYPLLPLLSLSLSLNLLLQLPLFIWPKQAAARRSHFQQLQLNELRFLPLRQQTWKLGRLRTQTQSQKPQLNRLLSIAVNSISSATKGTQKAAR